MIANYFLLCLFGASACFVASTIAREAILNGFDESDPSGFPYQASLQNSHHRHICGAGFIRNLYVLTAAHCVLNDADQFLDGLNVLARTIDINANEPPAVRVGVKVVSVPREYNPDTAIGDIAVLKLRQGLINPTKPTSIKWLNVPEHDRHFYNEKYLNIVGFGWNIVAVNGNNVNPSNGQLKSLIAHILSHEECSQFYPHVDRRKQLCAKAFTSHVQHINEPIGLCHGDTGGLGVITGIDDELFTVIGVLSRIAPSCNERHHPALYTKVSGYHLFIANVIADIRHNDEIRRHEYP